MVFEGIFFSKGIAFPFLGQGMNHDGSLQVSDLADQFDQILEAVAVDRPHVAPSQLFEQHSRRLEKGLHRIVHHLQGSFQTEGFGKRSTFSNFQGFFPKDIIKSGRSNAGQKLGKSTHIGVDTHSVVVIDEQ